MQLTPVPPSPLKQAMYIAPINWTVKFLDLPVKLVWDIASLTLPEDLDNFVLTGKAIYDVAKSSGLLQEHMKLKRTYERRRIFQNEIEEDHMHPIELLCAIRKNPAIPQYIRYMDLEPTVWVPWGKAEREELRKDGALRELLNGSYIMREAEQDIDAWHEAILGHNNVHFSWVFLLALLTHVTHLRLSLEWGYLASYDPDDISINHSFNIDRVVNMFCDPRIQRHSNAPLSRLAVIEPWSSDEQPRTPLQILAPFLALPSMRKVVVDQLEAGHDEHDFTWAWGDSRPSPLEEIEFTNTGISATHIARFMEPLQNLKVFRYSHGALTYGVAERWDRGAFMAALRKSLAAKTLEVLSLANFEPVTDSAISTFKGMERLRDLELDVTLLLGDAECGQGDLANPNIDYDLDRFEYPFNDNDGVITVRLVNILPPTVCTLKLLVPSVAHYAPWKVDCQKLFNGLVDERDKLPNLKEVRLRGCCSEDSEISKGAMPKWLSDLIEQTPSVGIAFHYEKTPRPQPEHLDRFDNLWLSDE